MALRRSLGLRRLLYLALALVLAAATVAAAGGAVLSTSSDEPLPASRLPLSRAATAAPGRQHQAPSVPTATKSPCPHPHKATGAPSA